MTHQTEGGRVFRPLAMSISMILAAAAAQAQQPAARGETTEAQGTLQEVVVTAQKREERLQDVPVAVSAIGERQLSSRGIQNVQDLTGLAPNVNVLPAANSNTGSQISIRGSVQQNPALYWDPTVGIYIDGVYLGKNLGNVFDVVDLERVEVLRGPQGTLYGRNTLAGAINLITRQPSGEFRGNVKVDVGNFNLHSARASLDLPRFGIASVSLAVRGEKRDGTTQTMPGSAVRELNNRNSTSARLAVNLDFSDTLQGAYRFDYTDINQRPLHSYLSRANLPFLAPYVTHDRDAPVSVDAPTFERSRTLGHSFTLTWDVNDTNTLKSITAYRQLRWNDLLDLDGSPLPVAHTARSTGGRDWSYNAASQELQLVGHTERFNYVGGLYYFKDSGFTYGPQNFFFNTFNFESDYGYGTKAWAAYGQADYKVTDAWTVTGGVRYTREKKELERYLGVRFDLTSPFFALTPLGTTAEHTFSATTPVLIVSYKFSDTVNAYAKYSQGFKSGGFNGEYSEVPSDFTNPAIVSATIANNIAESRTPFRPEKLKSYELGLKTSFADGRATVNVAAFENKTDDMQLSIFTAAGAAGSIIRNAGKATTRGVELEATWAPSDALRLQASYGYLDAKYDRFMDAGVNEADNRAMIHAPKNTINLLADARIVRTALGDLRGTLDYSWTDDYYTYPYQLASSGPRYNPLRAIAGDTRVTSYGVLNARLALSGIAVANGQAEVALWGRNITDENHITNYIDFGPSFGSLTPAFYLEPRTYGLEMSFRW